MNISQEKLIINKIVKGDTDSFGYFVDTYQDMAITIAYRICRNKQDAEDIVQNSFVKAFHNLTAFHFQSKFSTWFYKIVYNTAISYINNTSLFNEMIDYTEIINENHDSDWNIIEKIEKTERTKIINEAINKLSREESLLLTLFYLEENSIKDIILITGLSESNVKIKLHRGRKKLALNLRRILTDKEY